MPFLFHMREHFAHNESKQILDIVDRIALKHGAGHALPVHDVRLTRRSEVLA